jgi:DNA-directed RNA polymerase specialized sigma24 family protein
MSTLQEIRESLVEASRRYSRVAHEIEDLAHDIILSALRRGASLDGETLLRSAHGAARRHGAFLARSAGRRRARETSAAGEHVAAGDVDAGDDVVDGAPLSVLSPALRTTLFLLFLGLEKAELRLALGVTDAALRKRFQALREHGPLARPDLPIPTRTPALAQLRRRQVKLLPRLAARGGDRHAPRVLAASDPDGHGLIFAEALTPGRRTATFDASATNGRTRKKGNPCSTPRSRTSLSSS